MLNTQILTIQIDPILKLNAEMVFKQLGLSASQAVNLFYQQVQLHQSLPFESKEIPNETTIKALNDAEAGEGARFDSTDKLFEDLGIK
ncbi:MAG: type II toxin-antitoxin system RelB/DinJ family antitoxin [Pseudomonadota bacterium]